MIRLRGGCRVAVLAAALTAAGCVTTSAPSTPASGDASGAQGSLRQEEITVEVRTGEVLVRLTPLAESIVVLTAPDTRRRLESLSRATPATGVSFLVSVFTEVTGGADFEPRSITLQNRGRIFRPVAIRGLTPGWGTRLEQRRAEQAVFTFPDEVDLELELTVEVAGRVSNAWTGILTRIDAERARIRARGIGSQASSSNLRIFR